MTSRNYWRQRRAEKYGDAAGKTSAPTYILGLAARASGARGLSFTTSRGRVTAERRYPHSNRSTVLRAVTAAKRSRGRASRARTPGFIAQPLRRWASLLGGAPPLRRPHRVKRLSHYPPRSPRTASARAVSSAPRSPPASIRSRPAQSRRPAAGAATIARTPSGGSRGPLPRRAAGRGDARPRRRTRTATTRVGHGRRARAASPSFRPRSAR